MLRTWPEKVERFISIDWRSPMSASTSSKTGSAARSAGGHKPHWWRIAARPSVFRATVLPPVLGPLMTSVRSSPRSRSIGTALGGVEERMPGREQPNLVGGGDRDAVPAMRQRADGEREIDGTRGLDQQPQVVAAFGNASRELGKDALGLVPRSRRGFRQAVGELDDGVRLDEQGLSGAGGVVDDARHLRPLGHAHGQDRAAASLGEERLLERAGDGVRPCDPRELLADTRGDVAELAAQSAKERRCRIAKIGAVLLDRTVDGTRNRIERRRQRIEHGIQERRQRSSLTEGAPGLECDADGSRADPKLAGRKSASALSALDDVTDVRDAGQRRLRSGLQQRNRLGCQRLAPCHFDGIGRRLEGAGGRRSVLGLGSRRQALDDRRQLECRQRLRVHDALTAAV